MEFDFAHRVCSTTMSMAVLTTFRFAAWVCVGVNVAGCQVELKQDSPQAVVATFVKLYAKKDYDRVDLIMDGLGERVNARETACLMELIQRRKCWDEVLKCVDRFPFHGCHQSKECEDFDLSDCTCKGKGKLAAEKASKFTKSHLHKVLTGLALSPKKCEITESETINIKEMEETYGYFGYSTCDDVSESDELASVGLKCGENSPMKLLVRKREEKWFLVGFDLRTRIDLEHMSSPDDEAEQKKRLQDLNKDMR